MRTEVRHGPGELGCRLDHTLGEILVGASRPEFVIAALVPMPARPVRIKTENFFPLDLDAKGGAAHFALQAPQGPEIQAEVTCLGQRPNQDSAHIGFAIDHRRHRTPSSVIKSTRLVQPYRTTKPAPRCVGSPPSASGVRAVMPGIGDP